MITLRRGSLLLALSLLAMGGCGARAARDLDIPNPGLGGISDPAVRQGTLDNGLRYVIRANGEPMARAELRLVVDAGSILEDDDQRGLAHFVEHMAFNGTRSFARQELVGYLESIGMRFGPDVNAYTSFDETVYMLTVPTDVPGVLERGIDILEEWATGITFDSLQVEQERGVVLEEWRISQGSSNRLQSQQFPTILRGSRYPDRMPIGTYESLRTFDHAALRRFYSDWYRPDLMSVVIVGDFDPEAMEAMIRERFGALPLPDAPRPRPVYEVPEHAQTLVTAATDPEATTSSAALYFKGPPPAWRQVEDVRAWLTEWLASSMLLNRLFEYAQKVDSPILDASSFQGSMTRTVGSLTITTRLPADRTDEGLETVLLEVERAARYGFTPSELEREKLDRLRSVGQRYGERDNITSASYAAEYVAHLLQGTTVLDPRTEYELFSRLMPAITLKEVNAVARQWTRPANRVILVNGPSAEGAVPTTDEAARIVARSHRQRVEPFLDEGTLADLMPVEPGAGTIVVEREIPDIGAIAWELSNGVTVYLKPTDYRDDEILFAARSPGGISLYPDEDYVPALTASAVVQAGGLGELSLNDLRKVLAGTVSGVGVDIGEAFEGLSGASTRQDLEVLFKMAYLRFTAPRVDTTAFLAYRSQAHAALLNRSANPDVQVQDTLRAVLSQYHPRTRPLTADMLDDLDLARSFEIYRDRFADAGDFSFYIVGSFTLEEIRPLVERYLASLPSTGRVEEPRDLGIRPPTGVVRKVVRQGLEPRALTQIVFTGPFDFSRPSVLALQTLADVLRIRLRETLREDLGGTYGVTVRGTGSPRPVPQFQFTIAFGADPARIEELTNAALEEIERMKEPAPPPAEIEALEIDLSKVQEMQFRTRELDVRENSFWLTQMLIYDQFGWDLGTIPATPDDAMVVPQLSVRETAQRYLDTNNYVQVTLIPAVGPGTETVSSER